MNKTRKIKEIIGKVLAEKGFKYIRCERRLIWTFGRKIEDVEQEVYIQQQDYLEDDYKLMFWSSAKGNGMKEIGAILPEYENKEYWRAETDAEFIDVMEFFATFIRKHGFDLLEDMLTEKPDSFETPERKQYFKEHRKELAAKYDAIYHIIGNGTPLEQLNHIDDVLYENRIAEETPEEIERINELWLGMAAILVEMVLDFQGDAKVAYDTYRVEIQFKTSESDIMPIFIVVQAWGDYHFNNDRTQNVVWAMARSTVTYKL
ncbi:hypothetical protein [Butyrivibrio sp. X503]|uniref:hypothetical protein n=1 Tax=Butyrivibrio sp. X503 TaxID=2364878 RepID=UPI0011C22B9B|nr:hypothetical protein [Butyrivibrio sp. X503]